MIIAPGQQRQSERPMLKDKLAATPEKLRRECDGHIDRQDRPDGCASTSRKARKKRRFSSCRFRVTRIEVGRP